MTALAAEIVEEALRDAFPVVFKALAAADLHVTREGESVMNGKTWRFERAECAEFGECWLRTDGGT